MSTVADLIFDDVVRDILLGAIRPRDHISERDLVARFGVSRTPVREALKRLFERGFVDSGPKGVAIVAEIDPEELRSLYDLRIELEGYAAGLTVENISNAQIDELNRINKRFAAALADRDLMRMLDVRAEFHALTSSATKNKWLAQILVMLRDKAYTVRHWHWQDADRANQTRKIHEEMVQALRRRDAQIYRELVVQQIEAAIISYEGQLRARPRIVSSESEARKRTVSRLSSAQGSESGLNRDAAPTEKKRRTRATIE
ncbi:GntR family transcriptional regulator [Paraburkholderia sp. J41]|uniref:GntR family transcriptional regulator n=1 Tax=Paraburkholderia sp. J41 TaxID=2805433 RepID=UPI002AC32D81|nr:GntR family transcriptional regulator [Paraburkholderia sp. J41]